MGQGTTDDESILVHVMAWCRQVASGKQAITWTNVHKVLFYHMSLGRNELTSGQTHNLHLN